MDALPTASVIICAYTAERWDLLVEAVASVRAQTRPPAGLVVVIDRNDELLARAQHELRGATVVANRGEPGISGARNTGLEESTGDVVAFLDDDAVAEPTWLDRLLAPYTGADVLGVGGRLVPRWQGRRPAWMPDEFLWTVGCSYTGLPEALAEVRNPIGANLSVRRSVVESVGGFHGELGHVAEPGTSIVTGTADETEFCIRASQANPGGRWLYAPDAVVHHVVTPGRTTFRFFRGRCAMEGASKAVLAGIAGSGPALASERRYATHVLPAGVLRELRAAVRGDAGGVTRAGAIVAGLSFTAAAYVRTRARLALR